VSTAKPVGADKGSLRPTGSGHALTTSEFKKLLPRRDVSRLRLIGWLHFKLVTSH
jgi:hypothetical protein